MYWQMTRTLACGMSSAAGEVLARGVDALRRDPGRQLVAVPLADRAVRLEADVRDDVRRVGLFERVRRRLEAGREVAGFLRLPLPDVAAGEHLRRVPGERLIDADDVRQHLVLDLDQPRRVDRVFLGVGGDRRDLVPLEHHDVGLRRPAGSRCTSAALTPGARCAAERSTDTTRACGCGERTMRP